MKEHVGKKVTEEKKLLKMWLTWIHVRTKKILIGCIQKRILGASNKNTGQLEPNNLIYPVKL